MTADDSKSLVLSTTSERKLRVIFALLLFSAFAAYFLYDGYLGYPARNAEALRNVLDPRPQEALTINKAVHPRCIKIYGAGTPLADLEKDLGSAPWRNGDELRWFGPAGNLKVVASGAVVKEIAWVWGPHDDVYLQRWIGFALLAAAAGFGLQCVRVMMTKAVLDETGLSLRGHRHIAFDEILHLDASQLAVNGWLDLQVRHGSHKPFMLRLDAYVYDGLDELVRRLCARKGWTMPDGPPAASPGESGPSGPRPAER
ncbi:MAG: hypothetical protein FLDDKLPJ_00256 [Phycisphaerae bacterium]|nr:hypothetical protein [Phycisphaerae bacterium]